MTLDLKFGTYRIDCFESINIPVLSKNWSAVAERDSALKSAGK
ncbi:MAG: hypothetical protein AVDCRST_MAG74-2473 [uncultured Pyrinomonadaceae bacterium]|uniref:Uncharacterized protein n=1 Tax=uncultured Pyrinomonadaceae bacterium TaxID=2283094 RepID=A0A6J4PE38_9BACT|nr:MAG: hypothetical protein AVDCRST_MAG74-2473 [uncultured Pyrinomonadaceae bacterium]